MCLRARQEEGCPNSHSLTRTASATTSQPATRTRNQPRGHDLSQHQRPAVLHAHTARACSTSAGSQRQQCQNTTCNHADMHATEQHLPEQQHQHTPLSHAPNPTPSLTATRPQTKARRHSRCSGGRVKELPPQPRRRSQPNCASRAAAQPDCTSRATARHPMSDR